MEAGECPIEKSSGTHLCGTGGRARPFPRPRTPAPRTTSGQRMRERALWERALWKEGKERRGGPLLVTEIGLRATRYGVIGEWTQCLLYALNLPINALGAEKKEGEKGQSILEHQHRNDPGHEQSRNQRLRPVRRGAIHRIPGSHTSSRRGGQPFIGRLPRP